MKWINVNGQRVNLNQLVGYAPSGTDAIVVDTHGGLSVDGETPYLFIKLSNENERNQLLNVLDERTGCIDFLPINSQNGKTNQIENELNK